MTRTKIFFIIAILSGFFYQTKCAMAATYWISSVGAAVNLTACSGSTPLSGIAACSYDKANGSGVVAGDTVYYRAGIYNIASGSAISPYNSGTSINRITFASYLDEQVNFVGMANDSSATAVSIVNKNWIKITGYDGSTSNRGLNFSNFGYFLMVWDGYSGGESFGVGSNYNEISYCEFTQTTSGWIPAGGYAAEASKLMHNSSYNWVHHNTFSKMGGYTGSNDISALLDLGWEDCGLYSGYVCQDETNNNVIEDNLMYHGGHHVIGIFNYNNVVRNNVFHNEPWYLAPDGFRHGYRVIQTQSSYNSDYHNGFNLIEANRISHASENVIATNLGGTGIHLSHSYDIIRYNSIYANGGTAIYVEVHDKTYGRVNYNHIYNNTFFANGYGPTTPYGKSLSRATTPERTTIYFTEGESGMLTRMYGNVVKNNLTWKSPKFITMGYNSTYGWDAWDRCAGYAACGDTVIDHNFNVNNAIPYADVASPIDPKFSNEGSYSSPTISPSPPSYYEWYWRTPDGRDVTTVNTEPSFTLESSSPAIDGGTYLTQANGSGSSSTTLIVHDASYFQPGWGNGAGGGASVAADWICVGTISNCVQISSINYPTNTITLASPMTWSNGGPIWLYKKSDGSRVLYASAPDYGAYEYVESGGDPTPPSAPGGLLVR